MYLNKIPYVSSNECKYWFAEGKRQWNLPDHVDALAPTCILALEVIVLCLETGSPLENMTTDRRFSSGRKATQTSQSTLIQGLQREDTIPRSSSEPVSRAYCFIET